MSTSNSFGSVAENCIWFERRHNALQLSDEIAGLPKYPIRYATPYELRASQQCRHLLDDPSQDNLVNRLGHKDARSVIHREVEYLLDL